MHMGGIWWPKAERSTLVFSERPLVGRSENTKIIMGVDTGI